jgi:hypothetical protein
MIINTNHNKNISSIKQLSNLRDAWIKEFGSHHIETINNEILKLSINN